VGQNSASEVGHFCISANRTPGNGFGPLGEGFLWLSAFGHRNNVIVIEFGGMIKKNQK